MAVDTRDKRASAIGVGLPFPRMLPVADSTVGAADRLFVALLYAGIAAAAPAVTAPWKVLTIGVASYLMTLNSTSYRLNASAKNYKLTVSE